MAAKCDTLRPAVVYRAAVLRCSEPKFAISLALRGAAVIDWLGQVDRLFRNRAGRLRSGFCICQRH